MGIKHTLEGRATKAMRKQIKLELHLQKPKKQRKHVRVFGDSPSWPKTPDQKKQSRPLIVTKPLKRLKAELSNLQLKNAAYYHGFQTISQLSQAPKHMIDRVAIKELY